jgi:transposase InsO family protein
VSIIKGETSVQAEKPAAEKSAPLLHELLVERIRRVITENPTWDYRHVWAHLAAVIDCHDREVVGFEFARRARHRWCAATTG